LQNAARLKASRAIRTKALEQLSEFIDQLAKQSEELIKTIEEAEGAEVFCECHDARLNLGDSGETIQSGTVPRIPLATTTDIYN